MAPDGTSPAAEMVRPLSVTQLLDLLCPELERLLDKLGELFESEIGLEHLYELATLSNFRRKVNYVIEDFRRGTRRLLPHGLAEPVTAVAIRRICDALSELDADTRIRTLLPAGLAAGGDVRPALQKVLQATQRTGEEVRTCLADLRGVSEGD